MPRMSLLTHRRLLGGRSVPDDHTLIVESALRAELAKPFKLFLTNRQRAVQLLAKAALHGSPSASSLLGSFERKLGPEQEPSPNHGRPRGQPMCHPAAIRCSSLRSRRWRERTA